MNLQLLCDQAIGFHQSGNLVDAERLCRQVLAADPASAIAHHLLGVIRFQQGRTAEALASFDAALASRPDYAEALTNRGNLLQNLKRFAEALASYDKALEIKPDDFRAHNNRGNALRALGRVDEALGSFDNALAIRPDYAGALNNRGDTLRDLQRLDEALTSFDAALAIEPHYAAALFNRALALRDAKRFAEALTGFDKLAALQPRDALALYHRATVLQELQRLPEALAGFDKVLAIHARDAMAWNGRGNILLQLKRFDEALANYDKALAISPDYAETWNNRGGTLQGLHRPDEALASYDRALGLKPDYAEAFYNRATVLQALKRFDEALASYDRALAVKPDFLEALVGRGDVQWRRNRRYEDALADLERAFALNPDYDYLRGDLLHLRMYCADWRDFEQQAARLDDGVRTGRRVATPFVYQVTSQSPADLQACAVLYAQDRYPAVAMSATTADRPHQKLRVGYVSGEFRGQATAFLTAGLYECHDKSRFEIVAFDNGRSDGSPMRRRLETAFDRFIDVAELSDRAAAEKIRGEEIDILVNLNGYFGEARMGIFAYRPAPIQVNYLGFPGTLGAGYIDYILADRVVIPENERVFYTEKVVYLPGSYQVNDARRGIGEVAPGRGENGLPPDAFVFCNFNQSYKLTPAMFAVWMRILRQTQGSVLWLLESNAAFVENLRREAARHGVAGKRLVFAPPVAMEDHLARHALADLFLDSLPCGAHTTASDALWTGLPLLTCRGKAFAGRVAASLLQAIDLPELITDDLDQYEALAIQLAGDPLSLQSLRKKLAQNRLTKPLFDTGGFTRHMELAFATMWEIHSQGESPRNFAVS